MYAQIDFIAVVVITFIFVSLVSVFALFMVYSNKRAIKLLEEKHDAERRTEDAKRSMIIGGLAGGMAYFLNNTMHALNDIVKVIQNEASINAQIRRLTYLAGLEIRKASEVSDRLYLITHPSEMKMEPLSLIDLLDAMKFWIACQFSDAVEISTKFEQSQSVIMGNNSLLKHAIECLVANAADAMPDGGFFSISLSNTNNMPNNRGPVTTKDQHLALRLSDSGVGMRNETQERVFEPFFTTKKGPDRLGLGLSLVYGILMIHGGIYSVESKEGHGTSINLYFPVVTDEQLKDFTSGNLKDGFPPRGLHEQFDQAILRHEVVGET